MTTVEPPVDHHLVHEAPAPNHERGLLAFIVGMLVLLAAVIFVFLIII